MKFITVILLFAARGAAAEDTTQFDLKAAERFASLALACVHKEYPNHITHTLNSDSDVAPPRKPFTAATTGTPPCTGIGCS